MRRIGIITASDEELQPFLDRLDTACVSRKAMLDFHKAEWNGRELILAYSGVCKVNAAIAAQVMIDTFGIDAMISAGTAGGIDSSIRVLDTVVSDRLAYHDVADDILTEFHPWLKESFFQADPSLLSLASSYALSSPYPIRIGMIASGESFVEGEIRDAIVRKLNPLAADMESAAVAHVCYANGVPFISVRTITDTAERDGIDSFDANCASASARCADIVLSIL